MKTRKPRSRKANGKIAIDICPYCMCIGCDSAHMSLDTPYTRKVKRRFEAGVCPSCGKPVIDKKCGCKSNIRNL